MKQIAFILAAAAWFAAPAASADMIVVDTMGGAVGPTSLQPQPHFEHILAGEPGLSFAATAQSNGTYVVQLPRHISFVEPVDYVVGVPEPGTVLLMLSGLLLVAGPRLASKLRASGPFLQQRAARS